MAVKRYSNLRRQVLERPGASERIAAYRQEMLQELSLAELRHARDLTQAQLAQSLHTTASGISRIEHEMDLYVSTLRRFIESMGGQLQIQAIFPDAEVQITTFSRLDEGKPPAPSEVAQTHV